jgi:hypothetical protein
MKAEAGKSLLLQAMAAEWIAEKPVQSEGLMLSSHTPFEWQAYGVFYNSMHCCTELNSDRNSAWSRCQVNQV